MSDSIEQKLPEELLNYIVAFATPDSLRNLCLASKTLNRLATPHFYSNIYLEETYDLPALAYLVFTSPKHATLINSFIVPDTWAKTEEESTGWSSPKPEDAKLRLVLRAKCVEYTTSAKEAVEMYEKIRSGRSEDAILALLLASLPKLRRLNINFGIGSDHEDFLTLWPTVMAGIRSTRISLQNSVTSPRAVHSAAHLVPIDVMVTGADDKYPCFPEHLAMFFHLPNARSIYAWRSGDGDNDPGPTTNVFARLEPRSCPVEYIELRSSKLHVDNFRHMLRATIPGKLKIFSYEVGCAWAWCSVRHPTMMASLQPHHGTLEALALSHEDFYPYQPPSNDIEQPYPCSFTPFTALKRLKVAPVYIWGHDGFTDGACLDDAKTKEMLWKALPENLEELWIARAHHQTLSGNDATVRFVPECLLPAIDLAVQNKSQAFPKLEHLRIELAPLMWKDEWFDMLASVCSTAAAVGIQSTIILFNMFDIYGRLTVERPWGWNEDIEWEPTRYSQNTECAKIWIDAAGQSDLAAALKDLKTRFLGENEKLKKAKDEIHGMGVLCRNCRQDPAYRPHMRIDVAQLERYVDERLHTRSAWKGRSASPAVVT